MPSTFSGLNHSQNFLNAKNVVGIEFFFCNISSDLKFSATCRREDEHWPRNVMLRINGCKIALAASRGKSHVRSERH